MATLADLLGSVNTDNMEGVGLNAAPVSFQRPGGGFRNAVGSIMDVLASMGGAEPGYSGTLDRREAAYNQAMQQQRQANVFRDFAMNPESPQAFGAAVQEAPMEALKFRDALNPQRSQGTLPREVLIANMLADPKVAPEVKSRLEQMIAPKAPTNPLAAAGLVNVGGVIGKVENGRFVPQQDFRRPTGGSGGGSGGGASTGYRVLAEEELPPQLRGTGVYQINPKGQITRVNTGKAGAAGAGGGSDSPFTPDEIWEYMWQGMEVLPKASSGGGSKFLTDAASFLGMETEAGTADQYLSTLSARLSATSPRFQGPQSDKDVALYKEMAADIGNASLTVGQRQNRLRKLMELQYKYSGPGGTLRPGWKEGMKLPRAWPGDRRPPLSSFVR